MPIHTGMRIRREWDMSRSRLDRAVIMGATSSLVVAGFAGTAAASPPLTAPATDDIVTLQSDPSVHRRPGAVVGNDLDHDDKAVVAAFQQVPDGSARVVTLTTVGRMAAVQAVRSLQTDDATSAVGIAGRVEVTTNDPQFAQQWAFTNLQLPTAWLQSRGAGVTVAVVDTGVDTAHPDLAANLVPGVDVIGSRVSSIMSDPNGHGTHVSGTIAAVTDNAIGVAGVAPLAKVMPVRVLDADGSGYTSDVAEGIAYAADHGAGVVNLSLGGSSDDPVLRQAVTYAQSRDVLVVAAAGNSRTSGNATNYPAAIPSVTAVAATASTNVDASFSNFGSYVDIAAPGVSIRSTIPDSSYASWSGTSMATPHVAAVAALVRSQQPALDQGQLGALLTSTATDLKTTGWDPYTGFGLVNPVAALAIAQPTPTATATATSWPTPTVTPTPTASTTPTPTASTTAPPANPTPTSSSPPISPPPVPGAVTRLSVRLAWRAATVSWTAPAGPVSAYRARYGKVVKGVSNYRAWATTTRTNITFPVSAGTWSVQVYAFNNRGNGRTITGTFTVRLIASARTRKASVVKSRAHVTPYRLAGALSAR